MIILIYSVKDKQIDAFLQPFFSPTLGSAIRSLKTVISDKNHEFSKNIEDYSLYHLGDFDDASGILTPQLDGPNRICPLSALVE